MNRAGETPPRGKEKKEKSAGKTHKGGKKGVKKGKKKDEGAPSSLKDCANCGSREGDVPGCPVHKVCSGCNDTYYCSRACQRYHWKFAGHRENCTPLVDRSVIRSVSRVFRVNHEACASEESECAICLGPMSEAPTRTLTCSHTYHAMCLERLRRYGTAQKCPLCRAELQLQQDPWEAVMRRWCVLNRRYSGGDDKVPWRNIDDKNDLREFQEIVCALKEIAETHPVALTLVASMYDYGYGFPVNKRTAVAWYQKAADRGCAQGQLDLGIMYLEGDGVPQCFNSAARWYRKAADQEHPAAQNNLAGLYIEGHGVPRDPTQAFSLFSKSAQQGYDEAMTNLAGMYFEGYDGVVEKNEAKGCEWLHKAARLGNARAQCNLGIKYCTGEGVPMDMSISLSWIRKAHAQGYEPARGAMRVVLKRKSVFDSLEPAASIFGIQNVQGDLNSDEVSATMKKISSDPSLMHEVQHTFNTPGEFEFGMASLLHSTQRKQRKQGALVDENEKVPKLFRLAADKGHRRAQFRLGKCYQFGYGIPENPEEALNWYTQAALQGCIDAQIHLSMGYLLGERIKFVKQDLVLALKWHRRAARNADPNAETKIAETKRFFCHVQEHLQNFGPGVELKIKK